MHGFADSSKDAYAAVVYVRFTKDGTTYTNLLTAKSRLAPENVTSIPRLELLACLLLAILICSVKEALRDEIIISRVICWSDSEVALHWIRGDKKEWLAWVENRVTKIRSHVNKEFWRHVPGEINPADLATRAGKISEWICDRWWSGPQFLKNGENLWPLQRKEADISVITTEMNKTTKQTPIKEKIHSKRKLKQISI